MAKVIYVDETISSSEDDSSAFPHRVVTIKRQRDVRSQYEMLNEIGRGKFGRVLKCRDWDTGEEFAAKFLLCTKREDRRNVEREVEIMNSLKHPKLLRLFEAYDNGMNELTLVAEYVGGGELFDRVIEDEFVLTERACVAFMKQILDGVTYMHSQQIVHLDLKPENVLCLSKAGNDIKIIDFGLARKFEALKKLQVLFGTPEFVAPEVVAFEPIGYATDMWAVGVICYVLLSGLSPFMGDTDLETMANVTIAEYDYEDEAFDKVSDLAKDFIDKLLIKEKTKRHTAYQCLDHPWLRQASSKPEPPASSPSKGLAEGAPPCGGGHQGSIKSSTNVGGDPGNGCPGLELDASKRNLAQNRVGPDLRQQHQQQRQSCYKVFDSETKTISSVAEFQAFPGALLDGGSGVGTARGKENEVNLMNVVAQNRCSGQSAMSEDKDGSRKRRSIEVAGEPPTSSSASSPETFRKRSRTPSGEDAGSQPQQRQPEVLTATTITLAQVQAKAEELRSAKRQSASSSTGASLEDLTTMAFNDISNVDSVVVEGSNDLEDTGVNADDEATSTFATNLADNVSEEEVTTLTDQQPLNGNLATASGQQEVDDDGDDFSWLEDFEIPDGSGVGVDPPWGRPWDEFPDKRALQPQHRPHRGSVGPRPPTYSLERSDRGSPIRTGSEEQTRPKDDGGEWALMPPEVVELEDDRGTTTLWQAVEGTSSPLLDSTVLGVKSPLPNLATNFSWASSTNSLSTWNHCPVNNNNSGSKAVVLSRSTSCNSDDLLGSLTSSSAVSAIVAGIQKPPAISATDFKKMLVDSRRIMSTHQLPYVVKPDSDETTSKTCNSSSSSCSCEGIDDDPAAAAAAAAEALDKASKLDLELYVKASRDDDGVEKEQQRPKDNDVEALPATVSNQGSIKDDLVKVKRDISALKADLTSAKKGLADEKQPLLEMVDALGTSLLSRGDAIPKSPLSGGGVHDLYDSVTSRAPRRPSTGPVKPVDPGTFGHQAAAEQKLPPAARLDAKVLRSPLLGNAGPPRTSSVNMFKSRFEQKFGRLHQPPPPPSLVSSTTKRKSCTPFRNTPSPVPCSSSSGSASTTLRKRSPSPVKTGNVDRVRSRFESHQPGQSAAPPTPAGRHRLGRSSLGSSSLGLSESFTTAPPVPPPPSPLALAGLGASTRTGSTVVASAGAAAATDATAGVPRSPDVSRASSSSLNLKSQQQAQSVQDAASFLSQRLPSISSPPLTNRSGLVPPSRLFLSTRTHNQTAPSSPGSSPATPPMATTTLSTTTALKYSQPRSMALFSPSPFSGRYPNNSVLAPSPPPPPAGYQAKPWTVRGPFGYADL